MIKSVKKRIRKLKQRLISYKISRYKYLHIIYNDKFLPSVINFLDKNFNTREQIICHSLYVPGLAKKLFDNKEALQKKVYWIIYGGDLYTAPRNEIEDYVRSNFKGYITCDESILEERYQIKYHNFFKLIYNFPIKKDVLDTVIMQKHDNIIIQINNSCDFSTLEMLEVLKRFKAENIIIKTILSYGDLEYKDEIIIKGKEIYGDKFIYLDTMLSPEKYAQELANNDILILNQNRQQGLGNTIASLYLGKKVFIRHDVTTYSELMDFGFHINDTMAIKSMDFNSFIVQHDNENKAVAAQCYNDNYIKQLWNIIFADK